MWLKEIRPGAFAGERWHADPLGRLYVPRGKGAFPSVTMMTTVPAVVAGVPEIAMLHAADAGGRRSTPRAWSPRAWPASTTVYKCRRRAGRGGGRLRHGDRAARPPRSSARAAPGWSRPSACSPT